jgi:hypothetical protein
MRQGQIGLMGGFVLALALLLLLPEQASAQSCTTQYYQGSTDLPLTLAGDRVGDEYTLVTVDITGSRLVIDTQASNGTWGRDYIGVGQSHTVAASTLQVLITLESRTSNGGEIEICTPSAATVTATPALTPTATLTPTMTITPTATLTPTITPTITPTSTAIPAVTFDTSDIISNTQGLADATMQAAEPDQPAGPFLLGLGALVVGGAMFMFVKELMRWRGSD